jgi:hypothetical protein
MASNWPPAGIPAWPNIGASTYDGTLALLVELGWSHRAPTSQERTAWFQPVRCGDGHTVVGRILVAPNGDRFPAALCSGAHREALAPWGDSLGPMVAV